MYHQRCCKKHQPAHCEMPFAYLHTYRLIHYILTGAAMYHQRCGKKYQCSGVAPEVLPKVPTSVKVLTAQVLPKYRCTTSAQLLPPPPKPGSSEERNERMQLFLPEVSWSFLWNVLQLGSASWSFLWNVLDCIIPKPELRRFGGSS